MSVAHLEILVEEPSMEAAMRALLPKLVGSLSFELYVHQGKADLLAQLPARLRGYKKWLPADWRIVVIVDRDEEDCAALKARLESAARAAKLPTRTGARGGAFVVVNRIAVEELEAWFFGDWASVRVAYPAVSPSIPEKAKYRDPDAIVGGTWEHLERVLQQAGYHAAGLPKIEAARAIAAHMSPERNTSKSFQVLRAALAELAAA